MESIPEHVVHRLSAAVGGTGLPSLRRYQLIEKIGEGGMAAVYRALDRQLGRHVAVKILRSFGDIHPDLRARFVREAQIGARLNHPNLCAVHDAGEEDGRLFIVMELVEERSLHDLLAAGPADRDSIVRLLEKAARAVHAAHEAGVIHRDLKPANILVTAEGEPKVADFGLARLDVSGPALTRTGAVAGTPAYMAPEQIRGDTALISPATDVYALGTILYQSLTGRLPFSGTTSEEFYGRILMEDPKPPGAEAGLDLICLKALRKNPRDRYPSAAAFAEDLRRHLDDEPVLARPEGLAMRSRRWMGRRKPVLAAVAVAFAAAAFAGVKISSTERERRDHEAALQASQRILERLHTAETAIHGLRFFFYNKDADIAARMAELETTVKSVELLVSTPEGRRLPEAWGLRGVGRYLLGDFRVAEASLLEAVRLGWSSGEGPYYLGKIHLERSMMAQPGLGEPKAEIEARERASTREALEWLSRPITPWNRQPELERDVVDIYRLLAEGRDDEVRRRCQEGLARHGEPWGAEEYWNLDAFTRGQHRLRRNSYAAALRIRPHYAWGFLMRGVCSIGLQEFPEAVADFERALRLQPRFAEVHACLAESYRLLGRLPEASKSIDTALDLDRDLPLALLIRAKVRHDLGDLVGARSDLDVVLGRFPDAADALWTRALLSMRERNPAAALQDFDSVVTMRPRWGEAHYHRAKARRELGDPDGALQGLDRAIELSPQEARFLGERARLHVAAGRLEAALADWNRAVKAAPQDPAGWAGRGLLKADQRDVEGALGDLKRALELAPKSWTREPAIREAIRRLEMER